MHKDKIPPPPRPLPERDERPATKQGLFRKFTVQRTDGKDQTILDKHYNCEYFVLDLTHDPAARVAVKAYAAAIEETHPYLARDLRVKYLGNV